MFLGECNLVWQDACDVLLFRVSRKSQNSLFVSIFKGSEVGNPGPHRKDLFIIPPKHIHIPGDLWSRTDQAHFSPEHVKKLGQFVELGFAEKMANSRDSWISTCCEHTACRRSIHRHSSKLANPERLEVPADTFLQEKR